MSKTPFCLKPKLFKPIFKAAQLRWIFDTFSPFSKCDDTEQFLSNRFSWLRPLPPLTRENKHLNVIDIELGLASTTSWCSNHGSRALYKLTITCCFCRLVLVKFYFHLSWNIKSITYLRQTVWDLKNRGLTLYLRLMAWLRINFLFSTIENL